MNIRLAHLITTITYYYEYISVVEITHKNKPPERYRGVFYSWVITGVLPGDIPILQAHFPKFNFFWIEGGYIFTGFNKPLEWGERLIPDVWNIEPGEYNMNKFSTK